jgi:hypothetical protein
MLKGTGGIFNLDNPDNALVNLAAVGGIGLLDMLNTGDLNLIGLSAEYSSSARTWDQDPTSVFSAGTVTASDRVYINTTGDLTLNYGISAQGSYTGTPDYTAPANINAQDKAAVVLVAGDAFRNNAGSSALSTAANNRFLVYSAAPNASADLATNHDFKMYAWNFYDSSQTGNGNNGYDYDNGGFGRSLPDSTAGSGFLYTDEPTLTITANNQNGTYGNTPALGHTVNTDYSASGYIDGDSDSNLTGTASLVTDATSASAVGDYDIGYDDGLTPKENGIVLGYDVVAASSGNGVYTVNQRPITITADAGQSMIYGDAVPTLTYSVTSGTLVNQGGNGVLSGALATNATSASDVGNGYTITQGSLDNANYDITYAGDSFEVDPRPISVKAGANQSKTVGTDDPAAYLYTVSYTGGGKPALVNGDRFTGKLGRDAGEIVGQYPITQGTLAVDDGNGGGNYMLTYVSDKFQINSIDTSSFTSAQTAITGTGVSSSLASATATQAVGPGTGTGSIVSQASNALVTDGTAPVTATASSSASGASPAPSLTGPMTMGSGANSTPVTVTHSGDTVSVTLGGAPASGEMPSVTKPGLPLYVSGSGTGNTYSIAEGGSSVSTTRVSSHAGQMPAYTDFANPPVDVPLTTPDGAVVGISVGISANGVLVIEVPDGMAGSIDPQTTLALAWAAAKQNFGTGVEAVTSAVIVPSSNKSEQKQ